MNRKKLVAALAELRVKIALLEAMLERDDDAGALVVLAEAEDAWDKALEEIR